MDRREFLEKAGAGAAFALAMSCLGACSNSTSPSGPVDFTLDLTQAANANLLVKGKYIISNNCVVVYGNDGKYYAATVICSHEGQKQVTYDSSNNDYYCTAHGARYTLAGAGQNSNGSGGLTTYNCVLSGTSLHVYS